MIRILSTDACPGCGGGRECEKTLSSTALEIR